MGYNEFVSRKIAELNKSIERQKYNIRKQPKFRRILRKILEQEIKEINWWKKLPKLENKITFRG